MDDESVGEGEYIVEAILGERYNKKKKVKEYLLKWKGYSDAENTWEPETNLDCDELIAEFYAQQKETWGKQRSELWQNLMGITNSKSKSRKPLPKINCPGSRNPMFASSDCYIASHVSRTSRPGFACSTISLKHAASEDLCETEDCAYSSESEDDEGNRQLRSRVIQVPSNFFLFHLAFTLWKARFSICIEVFPKISRIQFQILLT
ncbi:heterochromatin protein 1 [Loa loa]|uniref:Heterochromatin protein 1 n=1 Tax=Loa loa TaxID=7209 RepID=A0A1S0U4I8_LOALO|nr:heterochromatin protein 1 [Loa loa]EFO24965.2 heterochromatin protein 1 [Loa loa]